MNQFIATIRKIGNSSLGITIPIEVVAHLRLNEGDNEIFEIQKKGEKNVRQPD